VKRLLTVLFLFIAVPAAFAETKPEPKPAQTTDELRAQIEKVLQETRTPGVTVAIVHRDGTQWLAGIGMADVATKRPVTPDTLFRIGSISKAFTSLSILKLVNEGKLSFDDPVHKLVPEVRFTNRWEATDPVRVVHLLEHTTGWDDISIHEVAKDAPDMPLGEALNYDGKSRVSRWRPGTRFAYCNSGPAVAAYIVEKVMGQRFEDYVQQNFFDPIGMKTATYFNPKSPALTNLYHSDGTTPFSYWNILYRPAGAINASATDMAAYLRFYLDRGTVNGVEVMPAASLDRMESPTSTWAAREGLEPGYGLSNFWSVRDGFVYHGHDGAIDGSISNMAYMPEYGVGYFYSTNSINSGSTSAFRSIGKLIRAYITRDLQKPPVPPPAALAADATAYEGWYVADSPRVELLHFLEWLIGVVHVRFADGKLVLKPLIGSTDTAIPVTPHEFRMVHPPADKESPDPVATLALLPPNEEGTFINVDGATMKRVPDWAMLGQFVIAGLVCLAMLSVGVYAPFWILGGLSRKRRRPAERAMRGLPLLAVLCLVGVVVVFALSNDDLIKRMGALTVWSGGIWLCTVGFAAASVGSAFAVWRARSQQVRRSVLLYSSLVTVGLLIAAAYLTYWGIVGLRTWA
jgi:CubicO group peptidase (beta-lactamase class C family)